MLPSNETIRGFSRVAAHVALWLTIAQLGMYGVEGTAEMLGAEDPKSYGPLGFVLGLYAGLALTHKPRKYHGSHA